MCKVLAQTLVPFQKAISELYGCPKSMMVPKEVHFGNEKTGLHINDVTLAAMTGLSGISRGKI